MKRDICEIYLETFHELTQDSACAPEAFVYARGCRFWNHREVYAKSFLDDLIHHAHESR